MASPQLEEGDRGMLPYCVTGLGARFTGTALATARSAIC